MVGQSNAAMVTVSDVTTVWTKQALGITSSVDEENGLFLQLKASE